MRRRESVTKSNFACKSVALRPISIHSRVRSPDIGYKIVGDTEEKIWTMTIIVPVSDGF